MLSTGAVTTLAGLTATTNPIDGTGSAAGFYSPFSVALDGHGNLLVADGYGIRYLNLATHGVTTPVGFLPASGVIDGVGTAARLSAPNALVADSMGNLFIGDLGNKTLRQVVIGSKTVSTLAGTVGSSGTSDGTGALAKFSAPVAMTTDGLGNLYVIESYSQILRKVVVSTGAVTTIAGSANAACANVDNIGTAARFCYPQGVIAVGADTLYISDTGNYTIRKMVLSTGAVTTVAGAAGSNSELDGTGAAARFNEPRGITSDGTNLYVVDVSGQTVRQMVIATGVVSTLAGSAGMAGSLDGVGDAARFKFPSDVLYDGNGNLYVADINNHTVRKLVLSSKQVSTVIGTPGPDVYAAPGPLPGRLNAPYRLALFGGNLYIADQSENAILVAPAP